MNQLPFSILSGTSSSHGNFLKNAFILIPFIETNAYMLKNMALFQHLEKV